MKSAAKVHTVPRALAREPAVRKWSTDPVPPQHRMDYWRVALDAACGGALQLQSVAGSMGVSGSLRKLSLPGLLLCELQGVGQRLACASDSLYPVLVIVDVEHEWEVQQAGVVESVAAGDVAIVHATPGTSLDFRYGIRANMLAGSRPWAQRWLGGLGDDPSVRVAGGLRGWGRILSTSLRELAADPDIAANEAGAAVADMIGVQLAAALRTEPAPRLSSDLVTDAQRLCSERMGDSELNVREVAQMLGVSVRTLTRSFEDAGTTFSESLREMRLAQAAALLANADLAHLSVAGVGQQCGFVSASHFVREFRRRWGATPGQSRAGAAAAQTRSDALARLDRAVEETRLRVETQRARITRLSAAQSLHLPAAQEVLRTLEGSLTALERLRATFEKLPPLESHSPPQP